MPAPDSIGPKPDSYFVYDTKLTQSWINALQEELIHVLNMAGITPIKGDLTQFKAAIQQLITDASSASGLSAVEDDTDPHLGGDLDLGIFQISASGLNSLLIEAYGTGGIKFDADIIKLTDPFIRYKYDPYNFIFLQSSDHIGFFVNSTETMSLNSDGLKLGTDSFAPTAANIVDYSNWDTLDGLITQQALTTYFYNQMLSIKLSTVSQILSTSYNIGTSTTASTKTGWANYTTTANGSITYYKARTAFLLRNVYFSGSWVVGETSIPSTATITVTLQKNGGDITPPFVSLDRNTVTLSFLNISTIIMPGDLLSLKIVTSQNLSNSSVGDREIFCTLHISYG